MKKTKILSVLLAVVIMLSTMTTLGMTVSAETVYSDVNESMWSYGDIMYVSENGLMNGTGGSTFSPSVDVTRSMVVTVLYRMEDSPEVEFNEYAYADVDDGQFYSDAVIWAKNSRIVTSVGQNADYEDLFAPTRSITRQELATMFVRYAEYRYVITEKQADLGSFKDIGDVADWANKAMAWCNEAGLINGTGNGDTLSPKMTATREQFAAIIHRFKEAGFEYQYLLNEPKPLSTFTEPEYPLVNDADLYVAVDGSDSNPGTLDKPLATFKKAVEKVRELKKTAKDEIVVAFKAGNYGNLNIELTAEDAGTKAAPITYCKYGDGDVLFSNGFDISLDEFVEIEESEHYLFPAKSIDSIKKADLSNKSYIGEISMNSWLYGNNERLNQARFPNQNSSGVDLNTRIGAKTANKRIALSTMFANRFDNYHTYEGITSVGPLGQEYLCHTMIVASYSAETKEIEFTKEPMQGIFGEPKAYFQNISEELDYKGEFWVDVTTSTLYVYEPDTNYTLSTAPTFITFTDADYINIIGIDFKHTIDRVFTVNSDYVTINNSEIMGVGGDYAIYSNGYGIELRNSELHELNAGGIIVYGGDWEMLIPSEVVIDNNYIHDYGMMYQTYKPAVRLMMSVGTLVSHNEIANAYHSAIIYGQAEEDRSGRSIDNVIEYNYIHDTNRQYGDAGSIYAGRSFADRGNVIRYNIIDNIFYGSWGIYLDDGLAGQSVYGNLFFNPGACAVLMSGGGYNYICDNVCIRSTASSYMLRIWSKYAEMLEDSVESLNASPTWPGIYASLNRVPAEGTPGREIWEARWPELFLLVNDREITKDKLDNRDSLVVTAYNVIKNNLSFGKVDENVISSEHATKFSEVKDNPVFNNENGEAIPEIFVNPALGDYSIRPDSCYKLDIPFAEIGRY